MWRVLVVLATVRLAGHVLPAAADDGPPTQKTHRTTSAAIALGNLSGAIDDLGRRGMVFASTRVDLLLARGQYFGRIADYEDASALAEALVEARPGDFKSHLARARTRAVWHSFDAALEDLAAADQQGAPRVAVDGARAGILQAVGRLDEAYALRRAQADQAPDVLTLGALASVVAERGDPEEAVRLFRAAAAEYRDVTPFPLAWLAEREGFMWLRMGDLERARRCYAAANERLPSYPPVVALHAWLEAAHGDGPLALAILRAAATKVDDPQVFAALAQILPLTGAADEGARWRDRARARYEELLGLHPEAFGHHAAEFFLAAGADPTRALTLASRDLEVRKTSAAYALVLRAAEAAGNLEATCAAAEQYLHFQGPPAVGPLGERAAAERAHGRCAGQERGSSPSPRTSATPELSPASTAGAP